MSNLSSPFLSDSSYFSSKSLPFSINSKTHKNSSMDSENPLSYYQEYDKWYQSRFDPSEWPESIVNSTHCSYHRTLLVRVHQLVYPITESVLKQVFESFGAVEDITLLPGSENFQALLRFEHYSSCIYALSSLDGRNIYDKCCKLEIHHLSKKFLDEVVRQNPLGERIETNSFIHLRQMKLLLDYMDKFLSKSKPKPSESDCVVKVFDESPVRESKEEVKVFDENPDKETTKEAEVFVNSEAKLKAANVKFNEKQTNNRGALHCDVQMMDRILVKELTFGVGKATKTVVYKVVGENFEKVISDEGGILNSTVSSFDSCRKNIYYKSLFDPGGASLKLIYAKYINFLDNVLVRKEDDKVVIESFVGYHKDYGELTSPMFDPGGSFIVLHSGLDSKKVISDQDDLEIASNVIEVDALVCELGPKSDMKIGVETSVGWVHIVKFKMKLGETVELYDLFRKLKKVKMRSLRTRIILGKRQHLDSYMIDFSRSRDCMCLFCCGNAKNCRKIGGEAVPDALKQKNMVADRKNRLILGNIGNLDMKVVKGPAVLVGNSLGGFTALLAAASLQDQVERIVLRNSAGQFGDSRNASEDSKETALQKFIIKPVKDAYISLLFDSGGSSSQLVDVSCKHHLEQKKIVGNELFTKEQRIEIESVVKVNSDYYYAGNCSLLPSFQNNVLVTTIIYPGGSISTWKPKVSEVLHFWRMKLISSWEYYFCHHVVRVEIAYLLFYLKDFTEHDCMILKKKGSSTTQAEEIMKFENETFEFCIIHWNLNSGTSSNSWGLVGYFVYSFQISNTELCRFSVDKMNFIYNVWNLYFALRGSNMSAYGLRTGSFASLIYFFSNLTTAPTKFVLGSLNLGCSSGVWSYMLIVLMQDKVGVIPNVRLVYIIAWVMLLQTAVASGTWEALYPMLKASEFSKSMLELDNTRLLFHNDEESKPLMNEVSTSAQPRDHKKFLKIMHP